MAGRHVTRKGLYWGLFTGLVTLILTAVVLPDSYTRFVDRVAARKAQATPLSVYPWPGKIEGESFSLNEPEVMIPRSRTEIERKLPSLGKDPEGWALAQGGVRANQLAVSLQVNTAIEKPVIVTGVNARVLRRRQPVSGIYLGPTGGGAMFEKAWGVGLDSDPPDQRVLDGLSGVAWDFPISVGRSDSAILTVVGTTEKYDVDWVVDIAYVVDGKAGVVTVNDDGKPYRVTSFTAARESFRVDFDGRVVWNSQ